MAEPVPMTPLPWQDTALRLRETDEQGGPVNLFIGGPRGNGKTTLAQLVILRFLVAHGERAKALVLRPDTYKGASEFEDRLEELLGAAFPGRVARNRADHTLRVAGGGGVEFSALDAGATSKFQGREFGLVVADEAGNFGTLRHLDRLRSNLRSPGMPCRLVVIANPGGPAHSELGRRYVHGRIPWRAFTATDGETWVYITAPMAENIHLNVDVYLRKLRAACGSDSALLEAWTTGSWAAISGAFFADALSPQLWLPADDADGWREVLHARPRRWQTYVGIDWGITSPSVVLFAARAQRDAVGPGGRTFPPRSLVIVDELATVAGDDPHEGAGWPCSMLSEETVARCNSWSIEPRGVVDDSWGHDAKTLVDQFNGCGLRMEAAVKHRAQGWTLVKGMMAHTRDRNGDEPCLFISERCRYLAETLPILQRNPLKPDDIITSPKQPDHGADALRMTASYEPREPRRSYFSAPTIINIRDPGSSGGEGW